MMIIQNVGNEILLEQLKQTNVGVQNFEPLHLKKNILNFDISKTDIDL
jgi:hypothetical protein